MDTDQIIDQFLEREGITFELRAINDSGEVLIKFSDHYSADNLSGDAWKIDEYIEQLATDNYEHKDDDLIDAQIQERLERE